MPYICKMKFDLLRTRHGILRTKLKRELLKTNPDIDVIITHIEDYEARNLATIEKLKRGRALEMKKINGALRQTIQAHGPITKVLIGSASKRIFGALLADPNQGFFKKLRKKLKKWVTKAQ